jgi:hypothetical protein
MLLVFPFSYHVSISLQTTFCTDVVIYFISNQCNYLHVTHAVLFVTRIIDNIYGIISMYNPRKQTKIRYFFTPYSPFAISHVLFQPHVLSSTNNSCRATRHCLFKSGKNGSDWLPTTGEAVVRISLEGDVSGGIWREVCSDRKRRIRNGNTRPERWVYPCPNRLLLPSLFLCTCTCISLSSFRKFLSQICW